MRRVVASVALLAGLVAAAAPVAADSAAAERQYRVGRRLAAEGSPEAVAALQEVIALDPAGPLADDARVDLARYFGAPEWPEELGRMEEADVTTARTLLDKALEDTSADRGIEARYYRGLLLLEPYRGRSESGARLDLVAVATRRDAGEWASRARYAAAVVDERMGELSGARAAYQRVIVDAPASAAAARARVGLARLALAAGDGGRGAYWAQLAIDHGVPASAGAASVREAALRSLLAHDGVPDPGDGLRLLAPGTGVRAPTRMYGTHDGGVVFGGEREGTVLRLDARGRVAARWTVDDLDALAAGPSGATFYAAAGETLVALDPDGSTRTIADLGDFTAPLALATDGTGRFWLLDRKGQTLGRLDPAERRVVPAATSFDGKLATIVWDGERLVALEARTGSLLAIVPGGPVTTLVTPDGAKPVDLAVAPGGYYALLDGKAGTVSFFGRGGSVLGRRPVKELGPLKPVAIAVGPDGALHVFDGANAAWWRAP